MPELPEVETVVRDLRPLVVGRTIRAVRNGKRKLRRPWNPDWNPLLAGTRIDAIRRRGKWIVIELDRGSRLVVHLGMTGQFTAVTETEPEPDHLHLVFELSPASSRDRGAAEARDAGQGTAEPRCAGRKGRTEWFSGGW